MDSVGRSSVEKFLFTDTEAELVWLHYRTLTLQPDVYGSARIKMDILVLSEHS